MSVWGYVLAPVFALECVCVCVSDVCVLEFKLYRRASAMALATLWLQQLLCFASSVCQCGNIKDCRHSIFMLWLHCLYSVCALDMFLYIQLKPVEVCVSVNQNTPTLRLPLRLHFKKVIKTSLYLKKKEVMFNIHCTFIMLYSLQLLLLAILFLNTECLSQFWVRNVNIIGLT